MGNIRLYGSTSGYTELAPPAVAPDGVLTLPSGTGTLATQASVGLVKIVDQSFTAASSVSVNNCFTSAYENYKLVINVTPSTTNLPLQMRYRSSNSDLTASNYYVVAFRVGQSDSAVYVINGGSFLDLGGIEINGAGYSLDVLKPAVSGHTRTTLQMMGGNVSVVYSVSGGTVFYNTASLDGFTLYPPSGTITGTLRVYGYQN